MIDDIFNEDVFDDYFTEDCTESFFENAGALLKTTTEISEQDIDSIMISQCKDEKEQNIIRMICNDVDTEHRLASDLRQTNLDSCEWLELQVERLVKDILPDASKTEIEEVKAAIEQSLEQSIINEAGLFEKESGVKEK